MTNAPGKTALLIATLGLLASPCAALPGTALESLRAMAPDAVVPVIPTPASVALAAPGRKPLTASEAVGRLCAKRDPVAIVDTFVSGSVPAAIDADGDGRPDVEHGDVIGALYAAARFPVHRVDLKGERNIPHVAEVFDGLASDITSGRLRVSAVNLSHVVEVTWTGLNADLALAEPVTAENVLSRRAELTEAVSRMMDRNDSPGFRNLSKAIGRLTALGVPVFVAAGNHTPEKLNVLGFLPGVVSVGALDRRGGKAAFSGDSTLVEVWATGEHVFRRVEGGVDVDGDGLRDIPASLLSGGPLIASRFAGRPLSEVTGVLPTDPWLVNIDRKSPAGIEYLQGLMTDGLYPVEDLVVFFKVSPAKARSFASRGRYFDKTMQYPFEVDASGRVVFDPARDGNSGQAVLIPGTSFAAPQLCRAP